jgi:hypothetical protein
MLVALLDERRIKAKLAEFDEGALAQVQDALSRVVINEYVEPEAAEVEAAEEAIAEEPVAEAIIEEQSIAAAQPTLAPVRAADEGDEPEAMPDAFPDLPEMVAPAKPKPQPQARPQRTFEPAPAAPVLDADEDEDVDSVLKKGTKAGKNKKGKKGRQVVFDEERGETVIKRQRKSGRGDWQDWDDEL